jgi:hypothetical protein
VGAGGGLYCYETRLGWAGKPDVLTQSGRRSRQTFVHITLRMKFYEFKNTKHFEDDLNDFRAVFSYGSEATRTWVVNWPLTTKATQRRVEGDESETLGWNLSSSLV